MDEQENDIMQEQQNNSSSISTFDWENVSCVNKQQESHYNVQLT